MSLNLEGLTNDQLIALREKTTATMTGLNEIDTKFGQLIQADMDRMPLMQGFQSEIADLAEDLQSDLDQINQRIV